MVSTSKTAPRLCASMLFLLAAGCGNSAPLPIASLGVGSAGGTVAVGSGALAGTSLAIPPDALTDMVMVAIDGGRASSVSGYAIVGPAALFSPAGLAFAVPATATLVFDPLSLPPGTATSDLVVKRRDLQGRVTDLAPGSVDATAGRVTVAVAELATLWVAVASPLGLELADYLPLVSGDSYEFEDGLLILIDQTVGPPNLAGVQVTRLRFLLPGVELGTYLLPRLDGSVDRVGSFSIDRDVQEVQDFVTPWLPARGLVGASVAGETAFTFFEPFGSTVPSGRGVFTTSTTLVAQTRVSTPVGEFDDVL
jgi:hypothetical protein